MLRRKERNLENIPVGALGLIPVRGCEGLGDKVNDYLVKWRKESGSEHKGDVAFTGYDRDTFIIDADVPRFGSGEAKGIIKESVRGKDLYLMKRSSPRSARSRAPGTLSRIHLIFVAEK